MSRLRIVLLTLLGVCLVSVGSGLVRRGAQPRLPSLQIEVLNGSGTEGAAALAARRLRELGQDVIAVGNATHQEFEGTVLVDLRGHPVHTRRLAQQLGGVLVVLQRIEDAPADAVLILGRDVGSLPILTSAAAMLR